MGHDVGKDDDVSGNSDVVMNDVEQYQDVVREERDVADGNAQDIGSWPLNMKGSGKATYAEMAMKKVVKNIGSNFR